MAHDYKLSACFGKQTFKHASAKVLVAGWRTKHGGATIEDLDFRKSVGIQQMMHTIGSNKSLAGTSSHHGAWYTYNMGQDTGEEALIKLTVQKTLSGSVIAHSSLLFVTVAAGPALSVTVDFTPSPEATANTRNILYGRGYIITPEQAKDLYGLYIPKSTLNTYFDPEEVSEDFNIATRNGESYDIPLEKDLLGGETAIAIPIPANRRVRRIRRI